MQAVHFRDELRAADEAAIADVGLDTLVARAGTAVAVSALRLLGTGYGKRAVVVAGRGHNGDDGRVAASLLRRRGVRIAMFDPAGLPAELPRSDLVIDAAYGTGFRGEYRAPGVAPGTPVLAIDVPSGLDADTGRACEGAVRATHTVTMAALKPGLCMGEGPALAGEVEVAEIGISVLPGSLWLVEDSDVASWLPPRERETNKWKSACVVVAGSAGMIGAARFSTNGALRAGAGMVRWCVPGAAPGALPVSEAVARAVPAGDFADAVLQELHRCRALVIGPGLGSAPKVVASVRRLVAEAEVPVVVDADGLGALGSLERAAKVLAGRSVPAVLTPHDGEYERLARTTEGGDIRPGADRVRAARSLASRLGAIVLLKGSTTVVTAPDGRGFLVTSGSARLATAGTGDVLSGVIGAFLARGLDPLPAAALAAHVHGRAAGLGHSEGLVAGDLPELVAIVLSERVAEIWQRPAWAEVDLDAVEANARLLGSLVAPAGLCAVVKADGYGHGAVPVAEAALAGGATSLAVALVEEGVTLREAGVQAPILILSEPAGEAMGEVVARGLVPTVYTREGVKAIRRAANSASSLVDVEVKVDTGMHRVGADADEARAIVEEVVEAPELRYAGLWTHLAVADELADPFTALQVERFEAFRTTLEAAGVPAPRRLHVANSAGAIAHRASRYDVVRCGISLYGYAPSAQVGAALGDASAGRALRPALRWSSRVGFVRELAAGEWTSYGRSYELAARADIATVPVGYADGVPRALFETGGELLVGGRRRPVAGTVTMDQLLLDCGPDSGVRPGDEVVLIGSQGNETVAATEWAERLGTISYEILCRIGPRLARRHVRSGAP